MFAEAILEVPLSYTVHANYLLFMGTADDRAYMQLEVYGCEVTLERK